MIHNFLLSFFTPLRGLLWVIDSFKEKDSYSLINGPH